MLRCQCPSVCDGSALAHYNIYIGFSLIEIFNDPNRNTPGGGPCSPYLPEKGAIPKPKN